MKRYILIIGMSFLLGETNYPGLLTWTNTPTMSLAGGGRLVFNAESDRLNPATLSYGKNRQFNGSLLQFPSEIRVESISFFSPKGKFNRSLSFRHQSFGVFQGYDDEANETEKYQSGETHITIAIAKKVENTPLRWGMSTTFLYSQLDEYSSTGLAFNAGSILDITPFGMAIGVNIENVGFILSPYTETKEKIPSQIAMSLSKKLAHLPLQIMLEALYDLQNEEVAISFSGIFKISNGIQLRLGTSSERINQNIKQSVSQSAMSGTGFGLDYSSHDYHIGIGSYFYGTGGWIHGVEFGGRF